MLPNVHKKVLKSIGELTSANAVFIVLVDNNIKSAEIHVPELALTLPSILIVKFNVQKVAIAQKDKQWMTIESVYQLANANVNTKV